MRTRNAFTLIEVVVVLVLIGLIALVSGAGLMRGIQGYLFVNDSIEIDQKVELAMSRLGREIRECMDCNGVNGTISLPYTFENNEGTRELNFSNNDILLNNIVLIDNVSSFSIERMANGCIAVSITMKHNQINEDLPKFQQKIFPRNTYK
jgi:prepilin-type N-terminal cleavage/methylation domain-containing protein